MEHTQAQTTKITEHAQAQTIENVQTTNNAVEHE